MSVDAQQVAAESADAANMHATVPTLLLELQTLLGSLTASATASTERGRRPFRPDPDWSARLGELAYGLYLLADQTGVVIDEAVIATAALIRRRADDARPRAESGWPFETA